MQLLYLAFGEVPYPISNCTSACSPSHEGFSWRGNTGTSWPRPNTKGLLLSPIMIVQATICPQHSDIPIPMLRISGREILRSSFLHSPHGWQPLLPILRAVSQTQSANRPNSGTSSLKTLTFLVSKCLKL